MCTFLGTAGKINENDVSTADVQKSELVFLKDIYGTKEIQKKHLIKLLKGAKQTAMSLSDLFCVERHKKYF